jgi:iron complex transport system substrate-binding protein
MDKKIAIIAVVAAVLIIAAAAVVIVTNNNGGGNDRPAEKETISITDLAGRQVKLQVPLERVVFGDAEAMELIAAIAGTQVKDVIVGYDANLDSYYPDVKRMWEAAGMDFKKAKSVGSFQDNNFNWEMVASMEPDAVFIPMWCYTYGMVSEETVDKMSKAGIPVINLDLYMQKLNPDVLKKNCDIIGQIFNEKSRADRVAAYYKEQVQKVESKLSQIVPNQITYYYEILTTLEKYGSARVNDDKSSFKQTNVVKVNGEISPEAFAAGDVDLAFLIAFSAYSECGKNVGWGATVTESDIKSIESSLNKRIGWSDSPASKNGDVVIIDTAFVSNLDCWFVYQLTAKLMQPELYSDLTPVKSLEGFYKEFLPWVPFKGVWYFTTGGEIGATA